MLIALSPLAILGLGAGIQGLLFPRQKEEFFLLIARAYCLGLLGNLTLNFALRDLILATEVVAALAVPGFFLLARSISRESFSWARAALFLGLVALFTARIMIDPIQKWDARSIWFFQGKMIYYSGTIQVNWDPLRYLFANLDYPKLQPLLASQMALLAGFWNEFLPKFSLVHLFLPVAAFLTQLSRRSPGFFAFLLLSLFVPGSLLWEGYMDGYVGLFGGLGALFAARFFLAGNTRDLGTAMAPLGVAISLKNDGALLFGSMLMAGFFFLCWQPGRPRSLIRTWRVWVPASLFSLLPFVFWNFEKARLALPSQMFMEKVTFSLFWGRLIEGALWPVVLSFFTEGKLASALGMIVVAMIFAGKGRMSALKIPLGFLGLSAFVFLAGISVILICTSMQLYLPQHLPYTMGRVMLSVLQLGFVAVYFLTAEDSSSA